MADLQLGVTSIQRSSFPYIQLSFLSFQHLLRFFYSSKPININIHYQSIVMSHFFKSKFYTLNIRNRQIHNSLWTCHIKFFSHDFILVQKPKHDFDYILGYVDDIKILLKQRKKSHILSTYRENYCLLSSLFLHQCATSM